MRFQVGDTVKISKKSTWYKVGGDCNPKDTEGKIRTINDVPIEIIVDWDNDEWAYYQERDLKLVRR